MAELHYFPMYASDWLAGQATTLMTLEQEGAFLRLLLHSWLSAGVPCSIPDNDDALAVLSKMGKRWKTAGAFVKAQFEAVEEYPGNLRNPRLWEVYVEQMEKHSKRVIAGALGGKAKAKRKQKPSNATAMLQQKPSKPATAMLYQSESESELDTETTKKTTTLASGEAKVNWPAEAAAFWDEKVTPISVPQCGRQLKLSVDKYGWAAIKAALEKYVTGTPDWKTPRLDIFTKEVNKWVRFGGMKTTDEKGDLTEWGQHLVSITSTRKSA